ncbi:MAG: pseudouridine synthase, partial [Bradyrhizobium sp.]|uniref:pseudouridine synthase n=1 Tax=Bradyrhizobium sp. TaxID=376 RepID=UPI001DD0C0B7
MPRDHDKDNGSSRGRRDRPPGKRQAGAERRSEKKFAKRGFGDEGGGGKRRFSDRGQKREEGGFRRSDDAPRRDRADRPRGERAERPPRGDDSRQRSDRPRQGFVRRERDRGEEKPWRKREDRPSDERRGGDRPRFSRAREERSDGERPRFSRPRQERSSEDRPRFSRPREERGHDDRPKFGRPRRDRARERDGDREERPRRKPQARSEWQEHPRSERRPPDRFADRPRRDNEDESRVFAKRPAFGGRGAYRERKGDFGKGNFDKRDFDKRKRRDDAAPREDAKPKKAGERIAKVLARAGLASRREAEEIVTQGRVTVNGRVINSPALDVTVNDVILLDGQPLPAKERTRLFLYHKPRGLMTTHADPEGRPTVFEHLPEGLPRLISIGRLDFNTEGLLLLTNDGGLARVLELPDTGWLRRYRVRAHGEVTQAQLDELKNGVEVDGVRYGPIDATLERDQGANVWLVFAIREGKNREVRNVLAHLGLEVNRLIRVSYGPFQLGELAEGAVDEVKTRVLREQLGEKVIAQAHADFAPEADERRRPRHADDEGDAPR